MDWWPRDPDAFAAALILVVVLGALALVGLGRVALWVAGWPIWRRPTVKPSPKPRADYVARPGPAEAVSRVSRQETETETETEKTAEKVAPPLPPGAMVYTPEQIDRIKSEAKLAGGAEAFGLLLGAGHLAAAVNGNQITAAKHLVFGTSGRVMKAANAQIAAAAARVEVVPAARLVPVNDGDHGHVEL